MDFLLVLTLMTGYSQKGAGGVTSIKLPSNEICELVGSTWKNELTKSIKTRRYNLEDRGSFYICVPINKKD